MDPKPRRGRLRRWAALLAALVCRGGAWVRRAAAALRHRLARRRVAFCVKPGGRRSEERSARTARSPSDDGDPRNRAAPQEERRGRSPSARAPRCLTEDRGHGEDRDASAAAALVPSEDTAPINSSAAHHRGGRSHGKVGDASSAAALGPGKVTGASNLLDSPTAPEGSGSSPRAAATIPDKKNPEHGSEARNTGDRSVERDASAPAAHGSGEDTDAGNSSATQDHVVRSPSSCARRLPGHRVRVHGEVGEASAAAALGAGDDTVTTRSTHENLQVRRQEGVESSRATAVGQNTQGAEAALASPTAGKGRASSPPAAALVPDEEKKKKHGDAKNAGSTGTQQFPPFPVARQAEDIDGAEEVDGHGGCSGGERAQTSERSIAPGPAKEEAQEGRAAIDAPVGGVQPDLAAAPVGGSGNGNASNCGRRRHRIVARKKAAAPLLVPIDESEEDDSIKEDVDLEMQMHESYRNKTAACRKGYMYCLICHLQKRKDKELIKDQKEIRLHCKSEHQCEHGGILCKKKGCFVRAKCYREIGLHEHVCHNM